MAKVIAGAGPDAIADNMGVDATGQVFNSIVAVEQYKGAEMNAMVNPGAITATSMVKGATRDEIWNKILAYYSDFAGRQLGVNQEVYKSEAETNQRNQAIAMLMYAYGHIKANPLQATRHLHRAVLGQRQREGPRDDGRDAGERRHEPGDRQAGDARRSTCPNVLAVMATAGLYDDSGKWLYHDRPARQERRRRRHHRRVARQVRHRGDLAAARRGRQQRQGAEGDRGHFQCAGRQSVRGDPGHEREMSRLATVGGEGVAAGKEVLVMQSGEHATYRRSLRPAEALASRPAPAHTGG